MKRTGIKILRPSDLSSFGGKNLQLFGCLTGAGFQFCCGPFLLLESIGERSDTLFIQLPHILFNFFIGNSALSTSSFPFSMFRSEFAETPSEDDLLLQEEAQARAGPRKGPVAQ